MKHYLLYKTQVRAHWSAAQTAPGSTVSFRVRAHPQSLCAVSVVDQSLYFYTPETSSIDQDLWIHLKKFDNPIVSKNSKKYCPISKSDIVNLSMALIK